jgi:hypothetical protein
VRTDLGGQKTDAERTEQLRRDAFLRSEGRFDERLLSDWRDLPEVAERKHHEASERKSLIQRPSVAENTCYSSKAAVDTLKQTDPHHRNFVDDDHDDVAKKSGDSASVCWVGVGLGLVLGLGFGFGLDFDFGVCFGLGVGVVFGLPFINP